MRENQISLRTRKKGICRRAKDENISFLSNWSEIQSSLKSEREIPISNLAAKASRLRPKYDRLEAASRFMSRSRIRMYWDHPLITEKDVRQRRCIG
jgi:hypothetical protein